MSIRAEKNAIINTDPAKISGYVNDITQQRETIKAVQAKLAQSPDPEVRDLAGRFIENFPKWTAVQDRVTALAIENTTDPST